MYCLIHIEFPYLSLKVGLWLFQTCLLSHSGLASKLLWAPWQETHWLRVCPLHCSPVVGGAHRFTMLMTLASSPYCHWPTQVAPYQPWNNPTASRQINPLGSHEQTLFQKLLRLKTLLIFLICRVQKTKERFQTTEERWESEREWQSSHNHFRTF